MMRRRSAAAALAVGLFCSPVTATAERRPCRHVSVQYRGSESDLAHTVLAERIDASLAAQNVAVGSGAFDRLSIEIHAERKTGPHSDNPNVYRSCIETKLVAHGWVGVPIEHSVAPVCSPLNEATAAKAGEKASAEYHTRSAYLANKIVDWIRAQLDALPAGVTVASLPPGAAITLTRPNVGAIGTTDKRLACLPDGYSVLGMLVLNGESANVDLTASRAA